MPVLSKVSGLKINAGQPMGFNQSIELAGRKFPRLGGTGFLLGAPTSFLFQEDGKSYFLLEDGYSKLGLEA